jgi:hypothetical protein
MAAAIGIIIVVTTPRDKEELEEEGDEVVSPCSTLVSIYIFLNPYPCDRLAAGGFSFFVMIL